MKVELDKHDLIELVRSTWPPFTRIGEFTDKGLGYYVGGFSDEWHWNGAPVFTGPSAWDEITETELWQTYNELKPKIGN